MTLPDDIIARVQQDYPAQEDRDTALRILKALDAEMTARVLRCVIFAAHGDMGMLKKMEALARADWRDVVMNAEYEYPSDRRLRDFDKPFGEERT